MRIAVLIGNLIMTITIIKTKLEDKTGFIIESLCAVVFTGESNSYRKAKVHSVHIIPSQSFSIFPSLSQSFSVFLNIFIQRKTEKE